MQFFDLMVDVESAGLPPNGALLSIGAVFFDLPTQTLGPKFNRTIHVGSAVKRGGSIDPGTFLWWLRQNDQARKAVAFGGEPVEVVLDEFAQWIAGVCRVEDVRPWGNSASFDMVLIEGAYQRIGKQAPWKFWNVRDFRTVQNMNASIVEYDPAAKGDDAHNALADAVFQAEHLFKIKQSRVTSAARES